MGGRGGGIVTRIYDEYGITGTGVKRVAQRVGEVTGEVFSLHYSDVKGDTTFQETGRVARSQSSRTN
jgi:hypothetical protein